jgi:branched-chain amino acid transport system permease protein
VTAATTTTIRRPDAAIAAAPTGAAWPAVMRVGLIGAIVAIYLCLVGIVPIFEERPLINGSISLGQTALLLTALGTGYLAGVRARGSRLQTVAAGALAGLIAIGSLSLLVVVGSSVDLRGIMLHASPQLFNMLTAGLGIPGAWIPAVMGVLIGALAAGISLLPSYLRTGVFLGLGSLLILGLFAGLVRTPLLNGPFSELARILFAPEGLTPIGAISTLVVVISSYIVKRRYRIERRIAELTPATRRAATAPVVILAVAVILFLPIGLGSFFAQVIAIVALYVLAGLGLNITLGLAGLLDLGFVAFFAVGAYTVGLLTSTAEYGIAQWSFWAAVPFAVILAALFGAFLGLPILGIRGDYLAIATLGFGEIIRILAGSDLLKPILGGPRGIINIPKPIDVPPDSWLAGPNQIYYIALACAVVIAFVAWRLRGSRLGRAWIAIREDEDVAEALGINLIQTKMLAYTLGAAFAGLGGAIFASLIGSIFPSSIQLNVSINVAAIIIVGGMGSIPGVIVGAIFLIGLPELFREFSGYRFLFYGIALIAVMRFRPEGLIPSRVVQREMHLPENVETADASVGSNVAMREELPEVALEPDELPEAR